MTTADTHIVCTAGLRDEPGAHAVRRPSGGRVAGLPWVRLLGRSHVSRSFLSWSLLSQSLLSLSRLSSPCVSRSLVVLCLLSLCLLGGRVAAQEAVPVPSPEPEALLLAPSDGDALEEQLLSAAPRLISGASFHEQTLEEAPTGVLLISSDDIRASGARTLGQVLERLAGVERVSGDYVSIRGLGQVNRVGGASDASRILLLIDGVRQNDVITDTFGVGLDRGVEDIARIEVLKGPGSALYGTSAFAGVISIITVRGADRQGTEGRLLASWPPGGSVAVRGGGVSEARELAGFVRGVGLLPFQRGPQAALELRGSFAQGPFSASAGYTGLLQVPSVEQEEQDPDPSQPRPEDSDPVPPASESATSEVPALESATSESARVAVFSTELLADETQGSAQGAPPAAASDRQVHRAWLGASWEQTLLPGLSVLGRLGTDVAFQIQRSRALEATEGRGALELRARCVPLAGVVLLGGGELRAERVAFPLDAPSQLSEGFSRDVAGVYAMAELGPFFRTTFTLSGRYEQVDARAGVISAVPIRQVLPRAGLVTHLETGTVFKLFAGDAVQAPSLSMLFLDSSVGDQQLLANPGLRPEQLRSLELELSQRLPLAFGVRLNVFRNQVQDWIAPAETPVEGVLQFQNRGIAWLSGGELELEWQPSPRFQARGSVTRLLSERSIGGEVPLTTPLRVLASLQGRPLPRWLLRTDVTYASARTGSEQDPISSDVRIPDELRLDVGSTLRLVPGWELSLTARNLLGGTSTGFMENQLFSTQGPEGWIELRWIPADAAATPRREGGPS